MPDVPWFHFYLLCAKIGLLTVSWRAVQDNIIFSHYNGLNAVPFRRESMTDLVASIFIVSIP